MTDLKIGDAGGKTNYIDAQLMRDVKERASRPAYSTEEVLDTSAKIKEPGNEAFRAASGQEGSVFDLGKVVKLYHRRALASEGMGKMARAVEEIREALCLDPNNTQIEAKLKE
ncbi:MAG: hypothetical protein Q9175_003348 [Cornicularia normoerica]